MFETTQNAIKQSKDSLANLKHENKELRKQLAALAQESSKNMGKDSEVAKLEMDVSELRRKYDEVRHHCTYKEKELTSLTDQIHELEKETSKLHGEDTPLTRVRASLIFSEPPSKFACWRTALTKR